MSRLSLLVCLSLLFVFPVLAEEPEGNETRPVPEPETWTSEHELRIDGKTIRYQATAGTLVMRDDEDEPVALFGYTAYVAQGENPRTRPIVFAYNGGPGSASIWLHMGVLGPQRAVATDAGFSPNGPYRRVDNDYSILDVADLVMLDPVGTGFGRLVGEGKGEDFWGVDPDIRSVSDFIVRYVTEQGRWASPKYLLGESYGGMRSGGVAYRLLNRYNMALNGVVLVSPFMTMTTGFAGLGIDLPHVLYLPTFAATAWYHEALADRPDDFAAFMAEVERFAYDEYAPALLLGQRLGGEQRGAVIEKLARYTGLSEDYWDRADLRIDEARFTKELLRDRAETVGRVDSRFRGDMINRLGEAAVYDPMTTAIGPPFLAAFMDYYHDDLGVDSDREYVVSGSLWQQWDWKHAQPDLQGFELPFPNTLVDLSLAMKKNPGMQLLVQQGYYDLATPHLATKYYVDHLDITPDLRENVRLELYDAGHMMYIHEPSLVKFKSDLAGFIRASAP
ncbi:S10 family peptidase [Elongatibacter sediminis]|uniref:Carboxypeptidase n=1 Tax=Elongatibacter sediminis TaxID=3119006 RepID=A0AAW9RM11_9GAMM